MKWLAVVFLLLAGAAWAVEPGERLDDPALEARARELSKDIRCLVCRNESIDESDADLARDLRILVRERIILGEDDEQVVAYLVDRFGEYVLLRPDRTGVNAVLWLAGPLMLLIGGGGALWWISRRRAAVPEPLSAKDRERLAQLTGK